MSACCSRTFESERDGLTSLCATLVPLERAHAVALLDPNPCPVLVSERMLGPGMRLECSKGVVQQSLRSIKIASGQYIQDNRAGKTFISPFPGQPVRSPRSRLRGRSRGCSGRSRSRSDERVPGSEETHSCELHCEAVMRRVMASHRVSLESERQILLKGRRRELQHRRGRTESVSFSCPPSRSTSLTSAILPLVPHASSHPHSVATSSRPSTLAALPRTTSRPSPLTVFVDFLVAPGGPPPGSLLLSTP